ncbi:MAG: hypothetical protein PHW95_02290 [Patescibacteria group bacterium]|nr:hypothetical protein [Patescibacteria group bacterium]
MSRSAGCNRRGEKGDKRRPYRVGGKGKSGKGGHKRKTAAQGKGGQVGKNHGKPS